MPLSFKLWWQLVDALRLLLDEHCQVICKQ
jgi:hypothetical protein